MEFAIAPGIAAIKSIFLKIFAFVAYCASRFFPSLMFLLTFFGDHDGKYGGTCSTRQWMEPGQIYNVKSPGYPSRYESGSWCEWLLESDRPIRFTCERFDVPYTPGCENNKMIIQDGDERRQFFCGGDHSFSTASRSNKLRITLRASPFGLRGSFFCSAVAQEAAVVATCECGRKNPARIYGGEETGINEYPMMAAVIVNDTESHYCGGTIINEKQILSAAHCFQKYTTENTAILVGEHDTIEGGETLATKILPIETIKIHEKYVPESKGNDYDIAIVTLSDKIEFNDKVSAVCLPFQRRQDTFAGNSVQVVGWGAVRPGGKPSPVLRKAITGVITNQDCLGFYSDVSKRQLCTKEVGKNSCQYDSGGPLLWHSRTTGRLIQVGLVSDGSLCGHSDPGRNTRVGEYLDWIKENTPEDIKYCEIE